ncbi:MAG: class I SAM-dependent methyltransferase [Ideonella sp.]|nr:class I SAM-dependent methyltransferase [Ideonella sp.]
MPNTATSRSALPLRAQLDQSASRHAHATRPAGCAHAAPIPAAGRTVFRLLQRLQVGRLDVQLPDGSLRHFGTPGAQPAALLRLHDWRACSAALKSGDIGFAEGRIQGHWSSPDLPGLLRLLNLNRERLDAVIYGSAWGRLLYRIRHALHRNSRSGSRRNIHAHYDIGNAFYRQWLDESMNYSSAWFDGQRSHPLPQAQAAKVGRALDEARVAPGQRVLEIGCGWGAVAEAVAGERRAHLTGLTLSTEQLEFAQQRMARAGLSERTDLRLQDYRDLSDEPFDAVVSIEMFEAVGREYWPTFFETVKRQLKPGGRACIQTITIRDELFERYVKSTDFIQQYIFPGGLLPSPGEFSRAAARAGLVVDNTLAFGPDYAETLRRWRAGFHAQAVAIRAQGFDEAFVRTWDLYLAYCEAAFDTGSTDVVQFTLRHA